MIWSQSTDISTQGQVAKDTGSTATRTYAYDRLGQLTKAQQSTTVTGCVTRQYAFDAHSNRTAKTTTPSAADGHLRHHRSNRREWDYVSPVGYETGANTAAWQPLAWKFLNEGCLPTCGRQAAFAVLICTLFLSCPRVKYLGRWMGPEGM